MCVDDVTLKLREKIGKNEMCAFSKKKNLEDAFLLNIRLLQIFVVFHNFNLHKNFKEYFQFENNGL